MEELFEYKLLRPRNTAGVIWLVRVVYHTSPFTDDVRVSFERIEVFYDPVLAAAALARWQES